MIDHDKKIIFIHIPKCAGTSVENIFNVDRFLSGRSGGNIDMFIGPNRDPNNGMPFGFQMQHGTMLEIQKYHPNNLRNYFKFTFVRNPWSRLVSEYFWRINSKPHKELFIKKMNFKSFACNISVIEKKGLGYYTHLRSQHSFTHDNNGKNMMDFIGKTENFQQDFNKVCDKIGIPRQQLPHENKNKHKHYTEYYDDETREIVAEKYARDIELFDYKFGE